MSHCLHSSLVSSADWPIFPVLICKMFRNLRFEGEVFTASCISAPRVTRHKHSLHQLRQCTSLLSLLASNWHACRRIVRIPDSWKVFVEWLTSTSDLSVPWNGVTLQKPHKMKKQRTLTQVCQVTSCFEHLKFARLFSRALDTTRQKLGLETGTSNHSYSMPFFASDILPGICNQAAIWTGDPQNSKIGTVIPERKIANKKSVLKTWFFAKIWRKLKKSLNNLLKCHDTHLKYERKRPLYPLKGWLHQNAPSTSTKTPPSPTHLLHQNTPSTNTPPPPAKFQLCGASFVSNIIFKPVAQLQKSLQNCNDSAFKLRKSWPINRCSKQEFRTWTVFMKCCPSAVTLNLMK